MNNIETNQHLYENEISLKELIMTLYNQRKLIVVITAFCVVFTLVYSFFIMSPIYEASSEALVNAPATVETRYGTYEFYTENASDYAQYALSDEVLDRVHDQLQIEGTVEGLRNRITISNDKDSSRYILKTTGETSDDAKMLNDTIAKQFETMIRIMMKKHALDYFIGKYEVDIASLLNSIDQKEAIITDTKALLDTLEPIYTLQKALFSDPNAAAVYANQFGLDLSTLSENVMVEEFANENFFKVEQQYTDLKLELISLNQALNKTNAYLLDLLQEKKDFETKYRTDDEAKILNDKLDVYGGQFLITSHAMEPESPVGPRKALNLAIGLVFGVMLGVFVAFGKAYWERA